MPANRTKIPQNVNGNRKKCLKFAIKSQKIKSKPRKLPKIPQKYAKNEMESGVCPKIELENT